MESIGEALQIGRTCSISVQISHLKTAGQRNWHKLADALTLIETAAAQGMDVNADRYPYTAGSTDLDSILSPWAYDGGNEKEMERLKNVSTRARLREEFFKNHPEQDCWEKIMIASVQTAENKCHEGQTLAQLAQARRRDPFEAVVELLLEERLSVQAIFFSMSEDNLKKILARPYVMIGSDSSSRAVSGKLSEGKPHPRSYGTFPRILKKYVLEERVLSLPEAIHKMTLLPARKFGIARRGALKEGMAADVVVLELDKIRDNATFAQPHQYSSGIVWVLVNGEVVVREGCHTQTAPGRVLLRKN